MATSNTAIVRLGVLGIMKSRKMIYEDDAWHLEPDGFLAANLGSTGPQLISAAKMQGHCDG